MYSLKYCELDETWVSELKKAQDSSQNGWWEENGEKF